MTPTCNTGNQDLDSVGTSFAITAEFLFRCYGPTLGMTELASVLKKSPKTMDNLIRAGRCPVPTYREGGHRVANAADVAEYLFHVVSRQCVQLAVEEQRRSVPGAEGRRAEVRQHVRAGEVVRGRFGAGVLDRRG